MKLLLATGERGRLLEDVLKLANGTGAALLDGLSPRMSSTRTPRALASKGWTSERGGSGEVGHQRKAERREDQGSPWRARAVPGQARRNPRRLRRHSGVHIGREGTVRQP